MKDIINRIQDLKFLSWTRTRRSSGTAGSFLKAYDDTGETKLYYKLSDYDSQKGIIGHECVNEIIAGRVMDLLGIEHLEYTLIHADIVIDEKKYKTWLCRSNDFKRRGDAKLAFEDYYQMEHTAGEDPFSFCCRLGWKDYICNMLLIDFLISNRDRHGANIEVLFDRKKKQIRPAPLFDHGLSFVCRCHNAEELSAFDVMKDIRIQSFIGSGSAFDNLNLIPKDYLKKLPGISENDEYKIFEELDGILDDIYYRKIWEMILRRWQYIEGLRNS